MTDNEDSGKKKASDKETYSVLAFNLLPDVEGNEPGQGSGTEKPPEEPPSDSGKDTAGKEALSKIAAMEKKLAEKELRDAYSILASAYEGDSESFEEAKGIIEASNNPVYIANKMLALRKKEVEHFAIKAGATDSRMSPTGEGSDDEKGAIKAASEKLLKMQTKQ